MPKSNQMALNIGLVMKRFYGKTAEEGMVNFYDSLSEKDRRRYAAVEALKLPHGGRSYICELLGCDLKTMQQGTLDLEQEEQLKKNE
jgi:hypothetical protein